MARPGATDVVLLVLLGTLAFVIGVGLVQDELRLSDEGVTVQGMVTSTSMQHGTGDDPDTYRLTYAFVDPATGREHTGSTSINERTYREIAQGDPIRIKGTTIDQGTEATTFPVGSMVPGCT